MVWTSSADRPGRRTLADYTSPYKLSVLAPVVSEGEAGMKEGLRTLVSFTDRLLCGEYSWQQLLGYLVFVEVLTALLPAHQKYHASHCAVSMRLFTKPSLLQTLVGTSLLSLFLRNCTRAPDASCISSQASVTSLCWGCPILCCFPSEKPGLACREKDFFRTTFSVEYLILVRVLSPS